MEIFILVILALIFLPPLVVLGTVIAGLSVTALFTVGSAALLMYGSIALFGEAAVTVFAVLVMAALNVMVLVYMAYYERGDEDDTRGK